MNKNLSNAEEEKKGFSVFLARLCTGRFDKSDLRSKSAAYAEKDIINIDETSAIRGRWNNRLEFLLSCIGFAVGLGNVWRFPIRVYESGGGAFLIPYTLLCLSLAIPLMILELGIGQFSGLGPTKAYKVVPLLFGLGWSMIVISFLVDVYYAAIISWSYFYFFGSFSKTMAWTVCTHDFNTPKCLGPLDKRDSNSSVKYVSSTAEYWDYYVTGFVKYPGREIYTMNEFPGIPQWHLAMCLLVTWVVAGFSLMFGVKVSGRIMYFTVLYPYVALFSLFCLGCTLPGALNGIKFYLTPTWYKIFQPKVLRGAVEQLFFSCSIAMGGMITYSSFNDFRDNFYRDAIVIVFTDFLTSLLSGFAIFPMLGYLAQRTGVEISKVIQSGSSLFFITFTEVLATLPAAQFWTILLMLMAITLGMDSQFAMFETVSTGIIDAFAILQNSKVKKFIVIWILSLVFFLCGLLLVTPGGKYWFEILDTRVSSIGLPLIALLEAVCFGLVYGYKQLRYDYRMMMGYSLSWYWFIMIAFVTPIIIFLILLASLIDYDRISIHGKVIPMWGEILAFFFLLILLSPIVIGMIFVINRYKRKYPELKGKELIKSLFIAPIYWGPFYKKNWLLGDIYREKLLKYKDDPIFLKYVSPIEDINEIVALAQKE